MVANQSKQYDVILDAREDDCPMPLLKTKLALNKMSSKECLCVITRDAGSLKDIPQYVSLSGHTMLSISESESLYTFIIQKN